MHEVYPGILEQEWPAIEEKIKVIQPFAHKIHIDLLDGRFADNTTFLDPSPFKKYSQDIFFELHMMVEEPESYLEEWSRAGFRRFIGHIEKMSNQTSFITRAEELGEVGLAVDAHTSLDQIKVGYEDLDTVLVMTIKAGFSGQEFMPEQLEKVKILSQKGLFPIEVDGGINDQTIKSAFSAGVQRVVATSFLFNTTDSPQTRYQQLTKA